MTKDEALDLALEALEKSEPNKRKGDDDYCEIGWMEHRKAITAIKQARALDKKAENARELGLDYEPVQEPVAMRMPKVGDRVVCIEDESLGTIVYLTAGGSPEIKFDDGSHGTYMLREFAELFGYTTPPAQPAPVQEPRCAVIVEVFGKDWRLDYMSLPVGKHKLYTQQYIYTTPPAQPAPVPLTDEEIDQAWRSLDYTVSWAQHRIDIARAIEAKLKEKNQ